ncbi:hypothetical protein F0U44_00075 [Nocardioides humilatus]|uniref:Uncharacterized protein n=1 Tax=Nocardioides humilatus TaxID=2607660 RepID=A0A5B1LMG0_9ACTN|nr:hypothetical protein [Nocardioides humilatus]KAA1420789.1 hypothetical protein F0U44_00075 [Nocardioides humilatus]
MPRPAALASRRLVIGGAAAGAALLVSGCGVRDSRGSATSGDPTAPAADADSDLVVEIVDQITGALSLAKATGTAFKSLRPLSRDLVALHDAHLDELGESADPSKEVVKGTVETARARLLRAEENLQGRLVTAALAAESGALAQTFASMAAAIAQQRAVAA